MVALTVDDFDLKLPTVESVAFPVYMALWVDDVFELRLWCKLRNGCQEHHLHLNLTHFRV